MANSLLSTVTMTRCRCPEAYENPFGWCTKLQQLSAALKCHALGRQFGVNGPINSSVTINVLWKFEHTGPKESEHAVNRKQLKNRQQAYGVFLSSRSLCPKTDCMHACSRLYYNIHEPRRTSVVLIRHNGLINVVWRSPPLVLNNNVTAVGLYGTTG